MCGPALWWCHSVAIWRSHLLLWLVFTSRVDLTLRGGKHSGPYGCEIRAFPPLNCGLPMHKARRITVQAIKELNAKPSLESSAHKHTCTCTQSHSGSRGSCEHTVKAGKRLPLQRRTEKTAYPWHIPTFKSWLEVCNGLDPPHNSWDSIVFKVRREADETTAVWT